MNALCDVLGIKYPVVQGGMAWVATAELAAAVSNAGGLGTIGSGPMTGEELRQEVRKAKSLTDRPFAVNVMLLSPHVDEVFEVILEEGVPVVTTGAGNPGKYMGRLKAAGIKVMPVVASVALAQRLEKLGVDAVIAEGTEAGGHIGELTTMVLVPQVAEAVKLPVVAAGGIADGRGMAAAMCLGAAGVQMGTRFICAEECTVHPNYKQAIIEAGDRDTAVTGRSLGHPVRALKNRFTRKFEELEKGGASQEEMERFGSGKLREAAREGNVRDGSVMAGQSAALVRRVQPAAEIINEVIREAREVLGRLDGPVPLVGAEG